MTETEYIYKIIKDIIIEMDCEVCWSDSATGLSAWICCNDIFFWGAADVETIEPSDIPDLEKALGEHKYLGALLWIARKRNLRPQGAFLASLKPQEKALFDCIEERPIDFFNPKDSDGTYKYVKETDNDNIP